MSSFIICISLYLSKQKDKEKQDIDALGDETRIQSYLGIARRVILKCGLMWGCELYSSGSWKNLVVGSFEHNNEYCFIKDGEFPNFLSNYHIFNKGCGVCWVRYVKLTLFCRSGLQPASSSSLQLWLCPFWQQRCSAANPPQFLRCRLALAFPKAATLRL